MIDLNKPLEIGFPFYVDEQLEPQYDQYDIEPQYEWYDVKVTKEPFGISKMFECGDESWQLNNFICTLMGNVVVEVMPDYIKEPPEGMIIRNKRISVPKEVNVDGYTYVLKED